MPEIIYPLRINRYLALKGLSTRRGADTLIEGGKVTINGRKAVLGDIVHKKDIVEVQEQKTDYVYFAYYKPREIVTHSAKNKEKDIEIVTGMKNVFPVGRLDKDSEGLIILTNDGRITDRLLNPEYEHEKEYAVVVDKSLNETFKHRMEKGVFIEGYKTKPAKIKFLNEKTFLIILTEGKKHQIRRMCAALGYQVESLKRTRVMNIRLGNLKQNQKRIIVNKELADFLKNLSL